MSVHWKAASKLEMFHWKPSHMSKQFVYKIIFKMTQNLRNEVLKQFKSLHKTTRFVFNGDVNAVEKARLEINKNFKQNKHVNEETTKELLKFAKEVETELRTNVIQAVEEKPGVFRIKLTEHTTLVDNVEFDESAQIPAKGMKGCCKDKK